MKSFQCHEKNLLKMRILKIHQCINVQCMVRYWITSRSNDLTQGINLVVGSHCWCEFMAMIHFQLYIDQGNDDSLGVIRCGGRNVDKSQSNYLGQQAVRRILILITKGVVARVGDYLCDAVK